MHRMTPLTSGFVGFSGGGARALVDTVNDDPMMQEMKGTFYEGEARDKIEAPQNYGFSSVVLPATKDKDGKIKECAEAIMSFLSGNRSLPVCTMMDDRRHRPMGLKPGENAQYDDIGQMTLLRRAGMFLLSLDSKDEKGNTVERMVSLRHVEKKKQERKKSGQQQSDTGATAQVAEIAARAGAQPAAKKEDFKHEGKSVNTEVRCKKGTIEVFDGTTLVAKYTRSSGEWEFTSKKMKLIADNTFEIRCKNGPLDLWGKPINFNGGGPTSPPFTVPGT